MTDKEKLKDVKKLADAMYYAAQYLTMNFRDKAVFRINRNEVGDCTLELCRHILWVIPYWLTLFTCPIHFSECLDFIRAWCCERNIGTAIIYDPNGANPKMTINYRRYKGEKLNVDNE